MKYLAVLGRLAKISLAELEAQFGDSVRQIAPNLAVFESKIRPDINDFGGIMKFGELITPPTESKPLTEKQLLAFLQSICPTGKIVLGLSDYGRHASAKSSEHQAMKLKKILSRSGRSVRVLKNDKSGALSTATAHHNQLGEKTGHIELMKLGTEWYLGIGIQNISAYASRDQARPARDAKVGMLPPKLAQVLINLCGPLPENAIVLDPFCGTGVVLQEAALKGFIPLGTDQNPRMVDFSVRNLRWLLDEDYSINHPAISLKIQTNRTHISPEKLTAMGDATDFDWQKMLKTAPKIPKTTNKISAVACETYLGSPMSQPPADIKLKTEKQTCSQIILGFLKNIHPQLQSDTPLALAVPAWRRPEGEYSRLNILDEITALGYNVVKFRGSTQKDLLYYRDGQVVAREIIVLRKK